MAFDSAALAWFRRDLRLEDHAALHAALTAHGAVHCAFVFDTEILEPLPRADRRVDFLWHSVAQLKAALERLGGGLHVLHGRAREVGATERAVRSLAPRLDMDPADIRRALESADRFEFEQGELYRRVFELAERRSGRSLPRALIPRIDLESPKFSRRLTTEWFATRVQGRYQRCVNTAFDR